MVGMMVALESFLKDDYASIYRGWERTAESIRSAAVKLPGVEAEVFVPEIANQCPHVRVRWNSSQYSVRRTACCRSCATANPPWSLCPLQRCPARSRSPVGCCSPEKRISSVVEFEKFSQEEFEREMHFLRRKLFMALGALAVPAAAAQSDSKGGKEKGTLPGREAGRDASLLRDHLVRRSRLRKRPRHQQSGWNQRTNRIRPQ